MTVFLCEPFRLEHRRLEGIKMRPGDHDKIAEGEELGIILPGLYLQKGIGAHDKKERLPLFKGAMIVGDGLDGIRRPLSFYLDVREGEGGVVGDGRFDHVPAVFGGDDGSISLMWRGGGQDKDYLAKLEHFPYLLGTAQVPQVDGIEGPPKQPDVPFSTLTRS